MKFLELSFEELYLVISALNSRIREVENLLKLFDERDVVLIETYQNEQKRLNELKEKLRNR
jgi:hypothetical protein